MIKSKLANCGVCADISSLIEDINCRIFNLSSSLYNNIIFDLNLHIDYIAMLDLLIYKKILERKLVNQCYLEEFDINLIANKVKLLKYK